MLWRVGDQAWRSGWVVLDVHRVSCPAVWAKGFLLSLVLLSILVWGNWYFVGIVEV